MPCQLVVVSSLVILSCWNQPSSEPLTLDKEVRMQEEWHCVKRKCTLVILVRDLLLLDLDILAEDRPFVAVESPLRIPLP